MSLELSFFTALKLPHDETAWTVNLPGSSKGSGNYRLEVNAVAQIPQSTDTDSRIAQLDEIVQTPSICQSCPRSTRLIFQSLRRLTALRKHATSPHNIERWCDSIKNVGDYSPLLHSTFRAPLTLIRS
jgi:hypothetical protein